MWENEKSDLMAQNADLNGKIGLFETQLSSLRDEVNQSKELMKQEQEKAALAIEKANRRRPAVGGIRTAAVASAGPGQAKKQLKFN